MAIWVRDEARLFDAADTQRITSAELPFALHVLTTSAPTSQAELEARVHDSIDAPDVVGIGIDPTHHWVAVRFGTGTGVARSQWKTVITSGNGELHDAHWADGVLVIARTAARARTETGRTISDPGHREDAASGASSAGVWVFGGVVLAVVALVGLLAWRARARQRAEAQRFFAATTGGPYRSASSSRSPSWSESEFDVAPAPVAASTSSHDLLTGFVMGSAMHSSPVVTHVVHDTVTHTPSFDSGTSFSSFGGGFDGGGGGFDGGGGSSSF